MWLFLLIIMSAYAWAKGDDSMKWLVIGEVVHTENGTYSINSNEVVCTNEDKKVTTFIKVDDNIYCIEYVKE